MRKYLIDTDIFVDFFCGQPESVKFVTTNMERIALSVIVLSELYAGIRNDKELSELDNLTEAFPIHTISTQIARTGGLLKKEYSKSHGIGLADALIAATATCHNLEIKSLNVKHYPMFNQLEPPYKK